MGKQDPNALQVNPEGCKTSYLSQKDELDFRIRKKQLANAQIYHFNKKWQQGCKRVGDTLKQATSAQTIGSPLNSFSTIASQRQSRSTSLQQSS
jgi:hypothetical protein